MTTPMPVLETARLSIRPFVLEDLDAIYRILDLELGESAAETRAGDASAYEQRRQWLEWSVRNDEQLALLYQPPYGDRAVVLRATGELIGAVGYVPVLGPFHQLPSLRGAADAASMRLFNTELGLYWAIAPAQQRRGYAREAARALIDYAFTHLRLQRVVATTSFDNTASIAVMRSLGMRVESNPYPDPPWFQVAGILENRPDTQLSGT